MKIRDVLKRLDEDGWQVVRQEGSHRILKIREEAPLPGSWERT